MVEPDRSQMTITYGAGKARSACWITNVRIQTHTQNRHALRIQTHTQNIDTHSEYRHTLIAFKNLLLLTAALNILYLDKSAKRSRFYISMEILDTFI